MNRLPLVAKILTTVVALVPAIGGALMTWQAANYHEVDPGAGNMPSFFPTALFGIVLGVVILLWSLPQLVFLIPVWRGRSSAFLTSSVLCVVQGALLMFLFFNALQSGRIHWAAGAIAALSIGGGVILMTSRRYLSARAISQPSASNEDSLPKSADEPVHGV